MAMALETQWVMKLMGRLFNALSSLLLSSEESDRDIARNILTAKILSSTSAHVSRAFANWSQEVKMGTDASVLFQG